MRTQEEIVSRIGTHNDMFGFASEVMIPYLGFDHAKQFLKPDTTREKVEGGDNPWPYSQARDAVLAEAKDYMTFAVEKARGHRGLSASRSIMKLQAWVWLLGDDDYAAIEWDDHENYGCPVLKQLIDRYEWTIPGADSEDFQRMARGEACRPDGCDEGCGVG